MGYILSDRLPDPDYRYAYWGDGSSTASSGYDDNGPGFASVKLTSDQKIMMSRTNSQRVLAKAVAGQKWNIDIGYHGMTREEFEPINAFLLNRQGPLNPFFVSLPQYSTPQNAAWKDVIDYAAGIDLSTGLPADPARAEVFFTVTGAHAAGSKRVTFTVPAVVPTYTVGNSSNVITNIPAQGDIVNISDANDTNHTKAYMITALETKNANYDGALDTVDATANLNLLRITLNPPLARAVSSSGRVTFRDPLFKVIMPKATQSYSLNTDNLYKFGLKLEEYL